MSTKTISFWDLYDRCKTTTKRVQVTKTFSVGIGDVFTRKKGYGWQRQVTHLIWIDDCLMCGYREHLNNGRGCGCETSCSVSALKNWGTLEAT